MKQLVVAILTMAALAAGGAENRKLKVLTSFFPVYCLTINVAGDTAGVENLLPPGATPHDFQLAPSDQRKLTEADLVIMNGLGAEPWLQRFIGKVKVVVASAGLSKGTDAHIWLDPILAAHAVTNILKALQAADPANAQVYETNAKAFIGRLQELDREFREGLAPVKGAAVVTYHDAFSHLARRYGLRVVGVVEETAEVPPSARHLAKLRRIIQREGVQALFTEAEHPEKLAEQLAEDFGIRMAPLHTLEDGELSRAGYEEGMRKNLGVLKRTLVDHASANAR